MGAALLLAVLIGSGVANGKEPLFRSLLTTGWAGGSEAKQFADQTYRELLPRAGQVPLQHAYALTLTHQHRYSEATKVLDSMAADREATFESHALRLWLRLVLKKPSPARAELAALVGMLPAFRATHANVADAWVERLGRCHGYLEAAGNSNGAAEDKRLAEILARVPPADLASYNLGRETVLAERSRRLAETEALQANQTVAADVARQNERVALNDQVGRISERLEALEIESRDQNDRYRAERQDLERRIPGVLTNLRQAQRNVDWIAIDLAALSSQVAALDEQIRLETDPVKKAALIRDRDAILSFLAVQQSQIGYALDSRAIARTDASILQRDRWELEGSTSRELARLEAQQVELLRNQSRAENRIARLDSKAAQPPKPSARLIALKRQLDAIKTYFEFPLEEERARLLESVGEQL